MTETETETETESMHHDRYDDKPFQPRYMGDGHIRRRGLHLQAKLDQEAMKKNDPENDPETDDGWDVSALD